MKDIMEMRRELALEDERDSERKGKTGNDVSELQELP
jgi:hypothetical protein